VSSKPRGLGRGLAALIPGTTRGVDEVDIDRIVPNPHQPRSTINDSSLDELVASIREHGVLQPLVVGLSEDEGVYQLIAGERRLRAARLAGLERVPVVVKEAAERGLLELALVENLQREDLNPLEEALAYRRLIDEFSLTQEEVATRVGRSRTAVANTLRLLALDPDIRQSLVSGSITEGHARALLGLENASARRDAWRQVLDQKLTVRQTEEMVRQWDPASAPPSADPAPATSRAQPDPDLMAIEQKVRAAVGTKVELKRRPSGRGRLVLHFYSDEELEGILDRLGVSVE
jgi:ParB family chromosome partitioning protein